MLSGSDKASHKSKLKMRSFSYKKLYRPAAENLTIPGADVKLFCP
jgi:hypothetical protein